MSHHVMLYQSVTPFTSLGIPRCTDRTQQVHLLARIPRVEDTGRCKSVFLLHFHVEITTTPSQISRDQSLPPSERLCGLHETLVSRSGAHSRSTCRDGAQWLEYLSSAKREAVFSARIVIDHGGPHHSVAFAPLTDNPHSKSVRLNHP